MEAQRRKVQPGNWNWSVRIDALGPIVDAVWICIALLLAHVAGCMSCPVEWASRDSVAAAFAVALFYIVGQMQGLYRAWDKAPIGRELTRVSVCWGLVVPLLVMASFLTKSSEQFSRVITVTWFVLAPALISAWRASVRKLLKAARARGYNTRTVAIVGASTLGEAVARRIQKSPWLGMKVIGFYDDRHVSRLQPTGPEPSHINGGLAALVRDANEGFIDVVYIALPLRAESRINWIIHGLQQTPATVYLAYDLAGLDVLHAQMGQVGNVPVMSVVENPFLGIEGVAKRAEDLVLASLILLLIALPMLVIALAIKLTSRGPVFFRQRRYGLNGEDLRVLKFRSMTVMEDGADVKQAVKDDARVTKVGAFLRRTSLDELPQFLLVLTGDMSIVGPRPHAVSHNEQYRSLIPGYMLRHKVKPGITGWAQVNGWRGETDTLEKMAKRVEYDLIYIRDWELWVDLKIIFMTIFFVLRGKNAY
jgi:putative colanic acid biosynthesis UDP-glucose lipid carrier transferase